MRPLLIGGIIVVLFGTLAASSSRTRHISLEAKSNQASTQASQSPHPALTQDAQTSEYEPLPNVLPGDTCEKVRALYGKESEGDSFVHSYTWKQKNVELNIFTNSHCVAQQVLYVVEPGHTATTPDGVILGKDTFADVSRKFKPRMSETSPFISQGEGQVWATIELPPTQTFPFKSTYDWPMEQPKIDAIDKSGRDYLVTDFTTETVFSYEVDTRPIQEAGVLPY